MPRSLWCGFLALGMSLAAAVYAAPLPPFSPVDITGKISEARWMPEQQVEAIPGMSGSAGHDRVFPAHFLIKLVGYTGIDAATAWQMTRLVDRYALGSGSEQTPPPFILLRIDHPDRENFRPGMTIRVTGYAISGDEGGTWTSHDRVDILSH
ncbi:MAG: hypothetical protein F9K32_15370 [Desulfobulbaceae bacterium]|nr:MAG: hypothetical protein F9K32_15370 [Desulfobulbaceae bacterium]